MRLKSSYRFLKKSGLNACRYGLSKLNSAIFYSIFKAEPLILFLFTHTIVPGLRLKYKLLQKENSREKKSEKFAFCSRSLPPLWSGQAVVIHRLLTGLDPKHYCLITQPKNPNAKLNDFIDKLPANYFHLPYEKKWAQGSTLRFVRVINLIWGSLQRAKNIILSVKNEGITAFIVGTGDQIDPIAVCIAAQLLRCRFYIYYFDDYSEQWWSDKQMFSVMKIMEKFIVSLSTGCIVPNEFMQRVLFHRHHKTVAIVHNPTAHNIIDHQDNIAFSTEIKLVFTGAVYNINGDTLKSIVNAISTIRDYDIKLHLYTAQSREVLKQYGIVGDKVIVHGHIPPHEVAIAQQAADILLIPFTFAATAKEIVKTSATAKLADYLITGKPIIAFCSHDSFLGWYFIKYQCGLIVPENNEQMIREAFYIILKNEKLTLRLAENAKKRAEIDFDPKKSQQKLLEAIGMGV